MSSTTAPAPTTPTTPARRTLLPPAWALLPIIVLVGYVTLLVTGYYPNLGTLQALPLYIYLSLLLIVLQIAISPQQSLLRVFYLLLSGAFAIIYVGEKVFGPQTPGNFTKSALFYFVVNILLVVVFVVDAVRRWGRQMMAPDSEDEVAGSSRRSHGAIYRTAAIDFAGLAFLFYISALLLDLLGPQELFRALGLDAIVSPSPYVSVDLASSLGLTFLPANLTRLQDLNLVFGYGATAIALLLLGLVGVLTLAGGQGNTPAASESSTAQFGGNLRAIIAAAFDQGLLSLRLVLSPLIWLIPAFSIAALAQGVVGYLNASAASTGGVVDLFNPLSPVSVQNIPTGFTNLGLSLLAVVTVILSVVVVERDVAVIQRTIGIFWIASRTVAVTLAFFIYSLAALNAFILTISSNKAEPFQVGAPGLIALIASVTFVAIAAARPRAPDKTSVPSNLANGAA